MMLMLMYDVGNWKMNGSTQLVEEMIESLIPKQDSESEFDFFSDERGLQRKVATDVVAGRYMAPGADNPNQHCPLPPPLRRRCLILHTNSCPAQLHGSPSHCGHLVSSNLGDPLGAIEATSSARELAPQTRRRRRRRRGQGMVGGKN